MRKPRKGSQQTRNAVNEGRGIPFTHSEYESLSVRGDRSGGGGGGGNGWRVRWLVDTTKAVPGRTYYLYQNIRTSIRELDADGHVIDHEVYTFCEVWKVSATAFMSPQTTAQVIPPPLSLPHHQADADRRSPAAPTLTSPANKPTTTFEVPSSGVNGIRTGSDAFEDNFLIPSDWLANAGRMVVRSQCWVESKAPGPSFCRNTKGGLWGTLRGRHQLRSPPPGAKVMERRFRAAWTKEKSRNGGKGIEIRLASIRPWNGRGP